VRVEQQIRVGLSTVIEAAPEGGRYGLVFEDDGATGYLYGLDTTQREQPIVDALHIYNVSDTNRGQPAVVLIEWNRDASGAVLSIDGTAEAFFDFARSRASCRSGFPMATAGFAASHDWDESALHTITSQV
jgi:hypothetical protein